MKRTSTIMFAAATLLAAAGGSATAATRHPGKAPAYYPHRYMAAPFDGYASYGLPGRSDVTASQPGWNPALDRAKGSL